MASFSLTRSNIPVTPVEDHAAAAGGARQRVGPVILLVAVCYFGLYLFIFRNLFATIPLVLSGDAVINGDELVPFFNPSSQLIEQAAGKFNQLTHGYEFRVRYSILTTWMRYYKILPFAILLVLPSIAFVTYLAIARFLAAILPSFPRRDVYLAAAGPALFVILILTYSKLTHFYTLVLGFAIYTVAATLLAYGIIFAPRRPYAYIAAACLCTLLNPAIHYLILFALYASLGVATLVLRELVILFRSGAWRTLWNWRSGLRSLWSAPNGPWPVIVRFANDNRIARAVLAMVLLACLTLIPYGLFVKYFALRGVKNLSETVPADFYFITDASIPWSHVLSFDMAGIMDKLLTGDYLAKEPRAANLVYTVVLFLPLLIPAVRRRIFNSESLVAFMVMAYTLILFSMWATLGYTEPAWLPTFHRTLAAMVNFANSTESLPGDLVVKLGATVVQVLRFPHRFQLIMFLMAAIMLPIGTLWIGATLRTHLTRWGRPWLARAVPYVLALLFLVPLFANPTYRLVFFSGDFHGFLAPYPVKPLQEVKDFLLRRPIGKVVVLPPTESAKVVLDISGQEHKFIDKFHIYYLDLPSFYYGLTGDSDNKHEFFLLLRALYYGQPWWINVARDIGIRYIVVNKEMVANTSGGAEYLRDIEKTLLPELGRHPEYVQPIFDNESYVVFEFVDLPQAQRVPLFIDTDWNTFIQIMTTRLDLSRYYDLRYAMKAEDLAHYDSLTLLASDPAAAALNLYIKANGSRFAKPDSTIFAFNPNVVPSSYYLSPMFRLFQFFSDSKWNRLNMITPGLYGTINGAFTAFPNATKFRMNVTFPAAGSYRLLLRGAATANHLSLRAARLNLARDVELRAPERAVSFYDQREVFTPGRKPLNLDGYTVEEVSRLIPAEIVAINNQFTYFDLGTVTAPAGRVSISFEKLDNSPLIVEGVLAIPEADYQGITLPPSVQLLDSPADLCCGSLAPPANAP
jgi:hypothetical protein